MMKLILVIILLISPISDLNKIKEANEHKKAAKEAYLAGDYKTAAYHYRYLRDSLELNDENIILNLANSLYKIQDSTTAQNLYNNLTEDTSPSTRSQAHQQLGLMDFNKKEYESALEHFKESLKSDPGNEDARYNYELLKKIIQEQQQQQQEQNQNNQDQDQDQQNQQQQNQQDQQQQNQDQQNQDQQNQDQQNQDQQNQDQQNQDQQNQEQQNQDQQQQEQQENSDEQQQKPEDGEESDKEPEQDPTTAEKLEEMNISEEKAKMILEAMKNNEIQYLQQNRRKAKERQKSGKPDW